MSPAETGERIALAHLADAEPAARLALAEDIRWAIVQGQIAARQPPELELVRADAIVRQLVSFTDDLLLRMPGASYAEQANALEACRARVLAMQKPAEKELARAAGA